VFSETIDTSGVTGLDEPLAGDERLCLTFLVPGVRGDIGVPFDGMLELGFPGVRGERFGDFGVVTLGVWC
jgi:hypothetical protein